MSTKKQNEIDNKPFEQVANVILNRNNKKLKNRTRIFTQNINSKNKEVNNGETN